MSACRKLAIAAAATLVALLACELVLRQTGRFRPPPATPVCRRPDLYQEHRPYGYRLWPSSAHEYVYPPTEPRRLTLVANRDGFRGRRELSEADSRFRIVVLGDSFVLGDGVEESERFTDVLEELEPHWRIDNLGMSGFGPDLMLRALENVGLSLDPKLVVVCMYTDDFRRVHPRYAGVGFPIPRYELRDGELVSVDYPARRLWHRFSISLAVEHVWWRASGMEYDLNRAILDRFRTLSERRDFGLAVVFLPGRSDTPRDVERRRWLREYARRHGMPFTDLTEPIHGAGRERMFLRGNWHLSPQGHRRVALELRTFLQRVLSRDSREREADRPEVSPPELVPTAWRSGPIRMRMARDGGSRLPIR